MTRSVFLLQTVLAPVWVPGWPWRNKYIMREGERGYKYRERRTLVKEQMVQLVCQVCVLPASVWGKTRGHPLRVCLCVKVCQQEPFWSSRPLISWARRKPTNILLFLKGILPLKWQWKSQRLQEMPYRGVKGGAADNLNPRSVFYWFITKHFLPYKYQDFLLNCIKSKFS